MAYQLISIILPIHNQADHLELLLNEYQAAMKSVPCRIELVLVVNACKDESYALCCKAKERHQDLVVIQSTRGGWGFAVQQGIKTAKGDLICYTNSSRTNAADLAKALNLALMNPNTVVKANRKIRDHFIRRLASLLYNLECRLLYDLAYWDINGTPKIFPRSFSKLLSLRREDDLIDLEFNIICRENQYPVLEIPIFSSKRAGGKSTTSIFSALRLYCGAFSVMKKQASLKVPYDKSS